MKRIIFAALVSAGLLSSCATTSGASADKKDAKAAPVPEKMTVSNVIPFDVASCGARPALDLSPSTSETVLGGLLSLGPAFSECFIDPKAVDGAALDAKVKVTVTDKGFDAEVTGTGLSQSGKDCVIASAKKLPLKPVDAGKPAVTGEVPLRPDSKPVAMGINVASDAVGMVRLAQSSMCECYASIGDKPAPVLVAKLLLSKDKPAEILLEPTEAADVATCVTNKMKALKLPQADASVPYQFLLKNAYATGVTETAQAALKFQQFDGMRAQRTADVLITAGKRGVSAAAYDAVVSQYKKKPTPGLIGELKSKCAAVVASDDVWLGSLKNLLSNYDASLTMVGAEKAKDAASWTPVETAISTQRAGTATEVARVETQKKNDEGACPKSSTK